MFKTIDRYLVTHGVSARDLLSLRYRGLAYAALGLIATASIGFSGAIAINILH